MNSVVWKISPTVVVCLVAAFIIAASVLARYALTNRTDVIDPRVTIDSITPVVEKFHQRIHPPPVVTMMEGEVARTAERVSEATALAMAASLCASTAAIKDNTPRNTRELLTNLRSQNLLPPGLTLDRDSRAFTSHHGILFVRYRLHPLGIEVLSIGRDRRDGPAILVRLPDEAEGNAGLFIATRLDSPLPPAFAPAAEIIAAGWSPEPLRSLR